jgi:ethanolamine utilization protein EutA
MHDDDLHDDIHIHDLGGGVGGAVEEIEGLEKLTLRSVGIDIGSSTSHLVFSRLVLRRQGAALSSQFKVTEREVLYRSPIFLTPYLSGTLIDTEGLKEFIHATYREAGFAPEDIDTGAVVITGEALKKENARPILELFARESGKFICASAGPNHEALLAAHGCGAVALSKTRQATVLNVDVGGGTSKLALVRDGVVTQTAAVNVGARLIAFDNSDVITRVEEPARLIMEELGHTVALGQQFTQGRQREFAGRMADLLFEVVRGESFSPLTRALMITEPLRGHRKLEGIDHLVFSGGVSEYIYDRDPSSYGDVGPLLGQEVRLRLKRMGKEGLVHAPTEGIRATVIGAGEYTIQASGATSYLTSLESLPAFGLKVVQPLLDGVLSVEGAVRDALAKFDLHALGPGLALAISLDGQQDYASLRRVAEGIAAVLPRAGEATFPLFLVLDMDVAKSLGGMLKEELRVPHEIIAVDGIEVGDLDYVDIGRPMGTSEVIPVTVKSLLFPAARS